MTAQHRNESQKKRRAFEGAGSRETRKAQEKKRETKKQAERAHTHTKEKEEEETELPGWYMMLAIKISRCPWAFIMVFMDRATVESDGLSCPGV